MGNAARTPVSPAPLRTPTPTHRSRRPTRINTVTTAASLSGYITVWAVCGVSALVAAVLLFLVPKDAFGERLVD